MSIPTLYVISLQRATDRRAHMRRVLDPLGIPYSFVDAVDGRTLDPKSVEGYDPHRRAKRMGSTLSANQLACALSHIGIFRRIAEGQEPYGIVLEDDVILEDRFLSTLELIPTITVPWEHLRLGGIKKRRFVPRQTLENGVRVGYYTGPVWGAEGYALTPAGARKLLKYKDLQMYIIDQAMERFWANGLISAGINPFQLKQVEETVLPSNIGYFQSEEAERSRAQRRNFRRWLRRAADVLCRRWHNLTARGILWDPPRALIRNQVPRRIRAKTPEANSSIADGGGSDTLST